MRTFSILYYTNDYKKYQDFCSLCERSIRVAFNSGTQTRILSSFRKDSKPIPLFTCLRDLSNFLEDYDKNLSDIILLMDCALLYKGLDTDEAVRALMIEYPEVKFLFDENPEWVIFNKEDIDNPILEQNRNICENCLGLLEQSTEKGTVKREFLNLLFEEDSDIWNLLRILLVPITEETIKNVIENTKRNLSSLISDWGKKETQQISFKDFPDVKELIDKIQISNEQIDNNDDSILEKAHNVCKNCLNLTTPSEKGKTDIHSFLKGILLDKIEKSDWNIYRDWLRPNAEKIIAENIRKNRQRLIRQIAIRSVCFDFLTIPKKDSYFILNIVHSQDNLFDASNIRYAIKQWKYAKLDVHSRNFLTTQNSRRDNLAISVEEEKGQNRFNSYCLFANGFRVWPITSARELLKVNSEIEDDINPSIVVRDYDLQFFDSSCVTSGDSREAIKAIRGFRDSLKEQWEKTHAFVSPCWSSLYTRLFEINNSNIPRYYTNKFDCLSRLPKSSIVSITNKKIDCPIYFVSKGTWNVKILTPASFISSYGNTHKKHVVRISHYYMTREDGKQILCLPGLTKPISGIYEPFMHIPEIHDRSKATEASMSDYLDTTREGHSHGTSLDIYSTVKSLIRRAEHYYEYGKYIHAAILSNEAIEYLNGFHESLLLNAYHILAISENAIAMDTVGGDENALKEDSLFRINKIECEIDKILRRKKEDSNSDEDRREFKYNVLNQIFSACRKFCKEKEHFMAEDCFISAMAHTNEGFTPSDIWHEILTIRKRILKSWAAKKKDYKY